MAEGDASNKKLFRFNSLSELSTKERNEFAKSNGLCPKCGLKTHIVTPLKQKALNNDVVRDGVCLQCNPDYYDGKEGVKSATNELFNNMTEEERQSFAKSNGLCPRCFLKTHIVTPLRKRALNNEVVRNGVCLRCNPKCTVDSGSGGGNNGSLFQVPTSLNWRGITAKTTSLASKTSMLVSNTISNKVGNAVSGNAPCPSEVTSDATPIKLYPDSPDEKDARTPSIDSNGNGSSNNNVTQHQLLAAAVDKQQKQKQQQQQQQPTCDNKNSTTALTPVNVFSSIKTLAKKVTDIGTNTVSDESIDSRALHNDKNKSSNNSTSSDTGKTNQLTTSTFPVHQPTTFPEKEMLMGKDVMTFPFGRGKVLDYRESDEIYVIQIMQNSSFAATLYCTQDTFSVPMSTEGDSHEKNIHIAPKAMELNEAYESLEKMRRFNLEIDCSKAGVVDKIDYNVCTTCLLNDDKYKADANINTTDSKKSFQRIRQLLDDPRVKKTIHDATTIHKKNSPPCLLCAKPACPIHSCPNFRKEGITICNECVQFFQMDFIVNCVTVHDSDSRERMIDKMIDLYDRGILLLRYSSQYIPDIANALYDSTVRTNHVNVGSSSVGIVSGALGVAAAATIFTPAGPPLLIASLLFGGGATAVQTGTEAVNYFSEPRKLADRIIALHGMVHCILRVKDSLRDAFTKDIIVNQNARDEDHDDDVENMKTFPHQAVARASSSVITSTAIGAVGAEVGSVATRNVGLISKTGTAVARTARFARFAGGALSAATILLEAKAISSTIQEIRSGNPCTKADTLRSIHEELDYLPSSEALDEECRIYIGAMTNRHNLFSLEDAVRMIEIGAIEDYEQKKERRLEKEKMQHPDNDGPPEFTAAAVNDDGNDGINSETLGNDGNVIGAMFQNNDLLLQEEQAEKEAQQNEETLQINDAANDIPKTRQQKPEVIEPPSKITTATPRTLSTSSVCSELSEEVGTNTSTISVDVLSSQQQQQLSLLERIKRHKEAEAATSAIND